jgi:hypothetical protein
MEGLTMNNQYSKITPQEFDEMIHKIAEENIKQTLSLPGIYEIISEEYNNEALDRIIEEKKEKRREHLLAVIRNIGKYGFLCYQDAPFNGITEFRKQSDINMRKARYCY